MYLLYGRGFSWVPFEDELGLCSLHLFLWNIVTKSVSWTVERSGGGEVIIYTHVRTCLEFMLNLAHTTLILLVADVMLTLELWLSQLCDKVAKSCLPCVA